MDNKYVSSLSSTQIESILTGMNNVVGIVYRDSDGQIRAAATDNLPYVTRSKLAQDALYSPVEYFDGTHALSAADIGKTLASSGAAENIVILTTDVSAVLPIGTEVAVFWMAGASVKLQFTGTMRIVMPGKDVLVNSNLKLSKKFTIVALKKIATDEANGDIWTVQGDVEVVT